MRNLYLMFLIFSILFSFLLTLFLKPLLSNFVKDVPNKRSSHLKTIPSAGGLIFIIPLISYAFYVGDLKFILLIPLAIIGLIDDIFIISRIFRAFFQLLTISAIIILFRENLSVFYIHKIPLMIFPMVLAGLSFINIFNFMDGLDGLLAGCALLIFSRSLFLYSPELSILIGSLIVFLLFNWCPAKIFMGDIGSTFLGAIYFMILINSSDFSEFIMHILIATPLLIDGLSCILIRFSKKQNIFIPHKLHLYQRLNQAGFKHSTISLIYMGSTSFLVLISTLNNNILLMLTSLAVILLGLFLNKKYAVKFN